MAAEDHLLIRSWALSWKSLGKSEATLTNVERELRYFGHSFAKPLLTATRSDCETQIIERAKVSQYQANYCWRARRSFYKWAAEDEEIEVSPMAKVRAPKVDEAPLRVVDEDDVLKLLPACQGTSFYNRRDMAIVALLSETGMRRSECAAIRLEDIDLDAGIVTLVKTKNRTSRLIPLSMLSTTTLLKYMRVRSLSKHAARPELWLGRGGAMSSDAVRQMLFERSREAGITVSAHHLRRTFASQWVDDGGNETALRTIAGWKTPSMVARYTRMTAAKNAISEYRRVRG